jgi:hypothetical protein
MPNLTSLDLSLNGIGAVRVRAIAENAFKMPNLVSLDLSGNQIGDDGIAILRREMKGAEIILF